MHKPWFKLLAIAALAVAPLGLSAQVMQNSYLQMFFNPTGDLVTTPGQHGIVFSPTSGGVGKEMIAVDPYAGEGWVLSLPSATGRVLIQNGGIIDGYGTVVDPGSGTDLVRTFSIDLANEMFGNPLVRLTQTVTLTDGGGLGDKRARFDLSVENLTGDALAGISYLRSVNAKQSLVDVPFPVLGTDNSLGSGIFPEGVAVDSTIPGMAPDNPLQRHLALGSTTFGAKVNATSTATAVNDIADLALDGYYTLDPVLGLVPTGSPIFRSGSDPMSGAPYGLNLWFDQQVVGTLGAGETRQIGTFYYVFEGPQAVPEPGSMAFLGAALGALFLLRRRRSA